MRPEDPVILLVDACQAGLMFFPDPEAALREMARVVAADGTVGVQVWDRREDQPAYDPFNEVVERHAGPEAVSIVSTDKSTIRADRRQVVA